MATQIKIIDTEKPKGLLFKQKWCSQSILKQYSLIVTAGSIKRWKKMVLHSSYCEKTIVFLFLNKG